MIFEWFYPEGKISTSLISQFLDKSQRHILRMHTVMTIKNQENQKSRCESRDDFLPHSQSQSLENRKANVHTEVVSTCFMRDGGNNLASPKVVDSDFPRSGLL